MAGSETRKSPPGTQVVRRVASILDAFTTEQPEWKLTPLAKTLGLTKPTAHRLLAALEAEGLLEHDPESHHYRLGSAAASLGVRAILGRNLRSRALPLMHALAAETNETCSLELRVHGRMRIIEEVMGQHMVGSSGSVGSLWPLHATSSGKAILSSLTETRRGELLELPLERFTPSTITDLEKLNRELDRSAEQGYAIAIHELEVGYSAVSVAIRLGSVDPVAALGIGGPSSRLGEDELHRLGQRLRQSAGQLSALLIRAST